MEAEAKHRTSNILLTTFIFVAAETFASEERSRLCHQSDFW
jgi:hypothetical protein